MAYIQNKYITTEKALVERYLKDLLLNANTEREGPYDSQYIHDLTALSDTSYKILREVAYNALNQLELISDDAINGTTTYADAITAIKAEFPKPV